MKRGAVAVAAAVLLGVAGSVEAHMRDFVLSQDYYTAKRGEVEVELYNDLSVPEADNSDANNSKHQIEVEYGVFDHFQLAYYEVYTWDRENDWQRDAFKIEAKLRFAEAGQWPVDLALYTEYKNPNGRQDVASDELENKIIVHKDIGPVSLVGNFVFEREIGAREHWEVEYTAGASYALTPRTRLALEIQHNLGTIDDPRFDGSSEFYIMPTLAMTLTPHVRILAGPVFGVTRPSDDLQLKSIVEIEF